MAAERGDASALAAIQVAQWRRIQVHMCICQSNKLYTRYTTALSFLLILQLSSSLKQPPPPTCPTRVHPPFYRHPPPSCIYCTCAASTVSWRHPSASTPKMAAIHLSEGQRPGGGGVGWGAFAGLPLTYGAEREEAVLRTPQYLRVLL